MLWKWIRFDLFSALVFLSIHFAMARMTAADTANPTERRREPNIVFILIDDLRSDTFSFMQHPFVQTPEIDRLAEQGRVFRNAFVTTSLCSPARASFLTGQYMHHHRVVDNSDPMPAGTIIFPRLLQNAGYATAFIGKWHMGGADDAPQQGFSHWVSFRGQGTYFPQGQTLNVNGERLPRRNYMTDELTEYAVDWLKQQTTDKPFLLYLSHKGVHGLYDPAPRHNDVYRDRPLPFVWQPPSDNPPGIPLWVQDQRNSWHGVEFPYYGRSGQTLAEMYRHYCEMILSIDDSVGAVRRTLEEQDLAENTLIVFTSDGGHLWGEHGLIDKRCAYEESIRIPMVISWPAAIPAGTSSHRMIRNIDLAPTLLDCASLPAPAGMDGRSLKSRLTDESVNPLSGSESDADLLYEYYWEPAFPQTPTTFCLREARYKLIQYHGVWDTDELFDLTKDPQETTNLIEDPAMANEVTRLRQKLYTRLHESGGLNIPLGFKRNLGSNLRRPDGTPRAEFPPSMLKVE
ncbi:MAG: sulfatase [Planctomycetaceae bacterium]|nr:sulfatase [Planctomycetaceae bacterium]